MANEPARFSTIPPATEGDYDAICAAVLKTARGRWFLEEFARRNRNADTSRVLGAIERIEAVIRGERSQQAQQGLRVELLEMARTIAQTRAEVAEIKPETGVPGNPAQSGSAAASDIFAAAQRLQDLAWTMREYGLDMATCEQIETLASTILSASSLRDPGNRRAQKLAEVLQYLEQRIDGMLDSTAERAKSLSGEAPAPTVEPSRRAEDNMAVPVEVTQKPAAAAVSERPVEAEGAPISTDLAGPMPIEPAPVLPDSEPMPAPLDQGMMTSSAPEIGPSSETLPTGTASEPEPADFLLEPLPIPLRASTAERPETMAASPPPPETIADLEEELFATPTPSVAALQEPPAHRAVIPQPARGNPFAALDAMSDDQRIALFT
jgi:hypothetical protein